MSAVAIGDVTEAVGLHEHDERLRPTEAWASPTLSACSLASTIRLADPGDPADECGQAARL